MANRSYPTLAERLLQAEICEHDRAEIMKFADYLRERSLNHKGRGVTSAVCDAGAAAQTARNAGHHHTERYGAPPSPVTRPKGK